MINPKLRLHSDPQSGYSTYAPGFKDDAHIACEADRADIPALILPLETPQATLGELRSLQIELELQNKALRQSLAGLSATSEHYRQLFEGVPLGYCCVNADGVILQANRAMASIVGRPVESLMNAAIEQLIWPIDRKIVKEILRQPLEACSTHSANLQMVKPDGSVFWTQVMARVVASPGGGPMMYVVLHDITERKREEQMLGVTQPLPMSEVLSRWTLNSVPARTNALDKEVCQRSVLSEGNVELDPRGHPNSITKTQCDITDHKRIADELLAAKHAAENANKAKSKFLGAASHNLRQPLAAMAFYVGALQIKADPSLKPMVNKITYCCAGLNELLNDLLEVCKLEAGVVVPRIVDFSIDNFMHQLLCEHAPEAAEKGLKLRWRPCNTYALSDPILMRRIMGTLLSNAIHYTTRGGILITYRRREQRNWMEVWDTGIGIEADKIDFIFEEFSQLNSTAESPGSGLGLAIMAKTADLLKLKVRTRSHLGQGTMFAVELPQGHRIQEAVHEAPLRNNRPLHIALVENNIHVLDAVGHALEAAGHRVTSAPDGALLLARLRTQAPDIIIADYRLAEQQTGYDVIEAARDRYGAALPALLMTGDTDPALIRKMSQRGIAIQYKPLQLETLIRCAMHQIEGRSP